MKKLMFISQEGAQRLVNEGLIKLVSEEKISLNQNWYILEQLDEVTSIAERLNAPIVEDPYTLDKCPTHWGSKTIETNFYKPNIAISNLQELLEYKKPEEQSSEIAA